ncbi:MAG: PQQ-dependent sugar dehydrogenase [Acidobacteriaceae bacterium]|nr:PQQ-dependent sugar dehydrogenase [Acidobacteriaceae bacterium]
MRLSLSLVLILGSCVLLCAIAQEQATLPKPYATPSADNHPKVVDRPSGAQLTVPSGFSIQIWDKGLLMPRFMLQGEHSEILIADGGKDATSAAVGHANPKTTKGVVYVYPNADSSKRKELITGLDRPYGLALWKNYLYVAETESIKRYPYDGQALTAGKGEEVVSLKGFSKGHWTRSLLFDPNGSKFYVGIGSAENVDVGEDSRRAAINRYNPDGTGHEIFAAGTRNPIGLHWYPGTTRLWAAVQERDKLGDNLVPDYFTHIEDGGFYGWPYAYTGPHPDPRIHPERQDLVTKTITPDLPLQSHSAVLDFTFYTGKQFPAEYHGGAFLAFHGSWNRSQRTGYSVVFVPFKDGKPTGQPSDFVTGWMTSPTSKDVWGRPVAVFQMQDGSLLVSDDGGKKIWRITYTAQHKS